MFALGTNSYFSESHYTMDDWKQRYWGTNYDKLHATKQKYDPNHVFGCYHCIGYELNVAM